MTTGGAEGWRVEGVGEGESGVGHGRHLVEAPVLEPWYRQPLPDPDTVARARHDFGDMILTQEVIDANPAPWDRM